MAGFSLIKIFTDTNILHASQAHLLIPVKVSGYIADHKKIESVDLRWQLPKMVIDERRHQMLQASVSLSPKLAELEKLLGHALGISNEVMEDRIDTKIRKTIDELGIEVLDLDADKVNWDEVISRSAKRLPPFEMPGEKEKGFRDAIIAETFLQELANSPTTPRSCLLVLVSGDKRLREYIVEKTSEAKNVRILETLDDLKSLLNAISSEITEEFLDKLFPKAKKVFWDFDKKEGLYSKGEIYEKIMEEYGDEINEVLVGFSECRRRPNGVTLGDQTFIKKVGQTVTWSRTVIVKSQIVKGGLDVFAGLFSGNASQTPPVEEQILANAESHFSIEWQHQITTKGNISKPKVNNIEFTANQLEGDE